MEERARLALAVLATALTMGALADSLLRCTPWGLNAAIWCVALLGAVSVLAARRVPLLMGEGRRMAVPALLFGIAFAWRDSPTLKWMDGCVLVASLGLMAYRGHEGLLRLSGAAELARGVGRAAWECLSGALGLLSCDIGRERIPGGRWSATAGAAGRGLLLALPLLLVFGWLLCSADAVFEGYVIGLGRFDVQTAAMHGIVTIASAWAVAGYLRTLLLPRVSELAEPDAAIVPTRSFRIGAVEIGTALAMVNLLFLAFVLVQLRYLFGGHQLVLTRQDFTCADYARSGFFELVWAAALALPLLLGAHAVLDTSHTTIRRMYALLAGGLVALLLVVLASAAQRMSVYQVAYGMTELRYYTSAFMAWLAAVFGWFSITVLRGKREKFAFGALLGAMAGVLILHIINPDAMIARYNLGRLRDGKSFDVSYAAALSGDALPALLEGIESLPSGERNALSRKLDRRWNKSNRDWRSWSLGRGQALASLARYRAVSVRTAAAERSVLAPLDAQLSRLRLPVP